MISERQLGLDPERTNIKLGPFGLEEGFEGRAAEFVEILRAEVGQLVLFDVAPEIFDRVEFRGISRQLLKVDGATEGFDIGANLLRPVGA